MACLQLLIDADNGRRHGANAGQYDNRANDLPAIFFRFTVAPTADDRPTVFIDVRERRLPHRIEGPSGNRVLGLIVRPVAVTLGAPYP